MFFGGEKVMGKFFKIGCLGVIAIVILIIVIAMFAGGGEESVSTGSDSADSNSANEETEAPADGSKTVDASSQTVDAAGMNVGLGEIKISSGKLEVGINLENTTDGELMFYPDQGSAVIGDMQLDANFFLTDGSVGGEVQSGVKQEGILEFLAPDGKEIDVESVEEIRLLFGDVVTEDFMTTEAVEFIVPVE